MSYIGQTLPADTFQGFTTDSFTGDGSATTFTLSKTPFNESALLVVINNVVQKPTTNFTVSGTTLTIVGTAVADGDVIYATHIGGALPIGQAASLDLNGASDQLILDADADTTISADTDDQIDFKIGGSDAMSLGTNFSLDVSGNIVLDADTQGSSNGILLKDAGTHYGSIFRSGSDLNLKSTASDEDIVFMGNDGGSEITALTLDMSASGNSKFNGAIGTGGETSFDVDVGGICLNQGAGDSNIMTFKSSDVAHGMTGLAETDTYGKIAKIGADIGGLDIQGFIETGAQQAIRFAALSTDDVTTKSVDGGGKVLFQAYKKSGTSVTAPGSNANILGIASSSNTRFIFDADGDFHADSSSTTFDEYDDAQLARTFDITHGRGVIESKFDKFISYNHEKLADLQLVGREKDGTPNHFINVTGMQRLHNGAIWQQYEKHQKLAEAVYEMAKEALGEDKANAILEKHDIKLLN